MKLLHLCPGNLYGGIERMLVTLARHRDVVVDLEQSFCVCHAGQFENELREAGSTVHRIVSPRFSRPWSVYASRRAFARLLATRRPDVIAMHGAWPHAIFGPVVRRLREARGVKLVFWLHDPPPREGRLPWLDKLASRCRPDLVISNSAYTDERVDRLFATVPRAIVRPAVDLPAANAEVRQRVRRERRVDDGQVVILQVGRWQAHKGHLQLLEALAGLKGVGNWTVWQAGTPQRPFEERYLQEVMRACARHGLMSRVEFLGWVPRVNDLYAAADVYCQPNTGAEPFGIAMVEAMACGLPVITTAAGGPLEIFGKSAAGVTSAGVLVSPGDVPALRDALRRLIVNASLRAALAADGPRRANELCDPVVRLRELRDILSAIEP